MLENDNKQKRKQRICKAKLPEPDFAVLDKNRTEIDAPRRANIMT